MSRLLMTTIAFATIVVAAPAFAQMSPSGGMSSSSDNMTCQDMMNKANTQMGSMSDDSKKTGAMKEMDMAKTDMAANREDSCKMHMRKVMGMM